MSGQRTTVIVEDEPALCDDLERQLSIIWPELKLVGKATDGLMALDLIESMKPDIAFMDIHIPELSGVEVLLRLKHKPLTVFVTAYDKYALNAFDAEAVDYILKPVEHERLRMSVERLQRHVVAPTPLETISRLAEKLANRVEEYLQWIQVTVGNEIQFVPVGEVKLFTADDKLTICCTSNNRHYIRTTLRDLEERLDPSKFWRVHRNSLINVSQIKSVKRDSLLGMIVLINGLDKPVMVSKVNQKLFHGM